MSIGTLSLSKGHNPNYVAKICKIGTLIPVPESDNLVKTVINGYDIVVTKDLKEGDIVIYFPLECTIARDYLSSNNLFEIGLYEYNSNAKEVERILSQAEDANKNGDLEEYDKLRGKAKALCGFFGKHGRVKVVTLRKQPSQGFIIPILSLNKWIEGCIPEGTENSYTDTIFDEVNGKIICKKYIPSVNYSIHSGHKHVTIKGRRFDKLIPEEFHFHYDTKKLNENIYRLSPDMDITISVKVHGTSWIVGNVLCKRKLSIWEKIKKVLKCDVELNEYSGIFSSRKIIKNRYIYTNRNLRLHPVSIQKEIWEHAYEVIFPYTDKGMTVYGEAVGYLPDNSMKMIQNGHDYGCEPGKYKLMPYRIVSENPNGVHREWDVQEVFEWTQKIISKSPEIADKIMPINILYNGSLRDLYPDLDPKNSNWCDILLARLKIESRFCMEKREPLCRNKVPREGIVIRINGDSIAEAFKLKTQVHFDLERKELDEGVMDLETQQGDNA